MTKAVMFDSRHSLFFLHSGPCFSPFYLLSHLSTRVTLQGGYVHFPNEEIKAWENDLPKVTQPGSWEAI